jgi:hypothetical protein
MIFMLLLVAHKRCIMFDSIYNISHFQDDNRATRSSERPVVSEKMPEIENGGELYIRVMTIMLLLVAPKDKKKNLTLVIYVCVCIIG